MAIYYATTKPISRSGGRSATASSAYRAGIEITDERTGLKHDYSKRGGVEMSYAFDKNLKKIDRSELWNKAELAENRKDGRTAREWVLAIPHELVPKDKKKRRSLKQNEGARVAMRFAKALAERYNVGVDVAIHSPDKEGDNRNWHAHIMTTTREIERTEDGIELGEKSSIELSNAKRKELGLGSTSTEIKALRKEWETIVNTQLEKQGIEERIDHRSLKEQGIERQPTIKMGWQASAMERRGVVTDKGDINRLIKADNKQLRDLELEIIILKDKQKQQVLERTQKPIEPQKAPQATNAPETTYKTQIQPNKATNTPVIEGQTVKEALEVRQGFEKMVTLTAEKMRAKNLKPYKSNMTRLVAEHKTLKEDSSWFGKGKREKQMKEIATEYKGVKRDFNAIKERDFTMQAREYIEHKAPKAHANNEQARETLHHHASFRYGATEAQAGRQYTGEITAVTRLGIMQKTPTGKKIYHDLDSFSNLPNVGDKVTVLYDKNSKAELVTADRAELIRQTQQAELEQQQSKDRGFER